MCDDAIVSINFSPNFFMINSYIFLTHSSKTSSSPFPLFILFSLLMSQKNISLIPENDGGGVAGAVGVGTGTAVGRIFGEES